MRRRGTEGPEGGRERHGPLKRALVGHYERQLERHGPTARGMDWKDEASQRLRFAVLCDLCDLAGRTVHEIGAGAGHLADYLRARGIAADYSGSDLSEAMVAAARRRHPGLRFERWDVLELADPPRFDVLLCSGLFFVKLDRDDASWRSFVRAMVRRMFEMCEVAIAFNMMSDQVDYRAPELYYSSPGEMLDFCRRRLSRRVALRHDYPLYEYSVYVYRRAPADAAFGVSGKAAD